MKIFLLILIILSLVSNLGSNILSVIASRREKAPMCCPGLTNLAIFFIVIVIVALVIKIIFFSSFSTVILFLFFMKIFISVLLFGALHETAGNSWGQQYIILSVAIYVWITLAACQFYAIYYPLM